MKMLRGGVLLFVALLMAANLSAQIDLTRARIIVDSSVENDQTAAELLADHIKKISGEDVEILSGAKAKSGDVVIGKANGITNDKIVEDGFAISTKDGKLRIVSGEGKGSIYGVCEILEKYFGVKYWSPEEIDIPLHATMELATDIDYMDNPAFEHRQVNGYGTTDLAYRTFNRLESPEELFVPGHWVHTFNRLVPHEVYGESHPEYFALINGERRPGAGAQLCLSNEDVLKIVVHKVDSLFKAHPDMKMISVSQNDGKHAHCTCDKCRAIDEREETLMGSLLNFANMVAAQFPDKEISTLSYLYSVEPPKYMRPRDNVNIMLCNIDCTRELPLTETVSGQEFVGYMEKWGKISNNIFMWDYGINFSNTVSPFPNFHVLEPNMKQFHKNNITKMFEQINSEKGTDFSELRSYMLAKLAWNPFQDGDAIMREFVYGYYKDAAPYIYDYLKLQQGGLMATKTPLWIFDAVPVHKNGFLKPIMIEKYNQLFDSAEEAVKGNPIALDRVKLSRLTLQYAELEILRTMKGMDRAYVEQKVNFFKERVLETGLKALDERGGSAIEYCEAYNDRFLPSSQKNLAEGAKIEFITSPKGGYAALAEEALTDGLYGGNTFVESWMGWEGKDAEVVIDLGEEKEISSIQIDCLHQLGQWVFAPIGAYYHTSTDGETFAEFGTIERPWDQDGQVSYKQYKVEKSPVKARFIKVKVTGVEMCPAWHYGTGNPGWIFIDEIKVL